MKAVFIALFRILLTLLVGWVRAIGEIWRWLCGLILNAKLRKRLPPRAAKGSDSHCNPIKHPSYRQPDPLIYDQQFLMSLGLAVTWDNPDIELRRNGLPVSSADIQPDTDYEIVARIWNGSTDAPVVNLPVRYTYLEFGIGTISHDIDMAKPTFVDLGVKGSPDCPAFAIKKWKSPPVPGHYCLQVHIDWLDDANPLNNLGQENLTVVAAHSPAEFAFTLRNDADEARGFVFAVDTYQIPNPPPCDRVTPPSATDTRMNAIQPATYRMFPAVSSEVRSRHDPKAHPLPEGWSIRLDPAAPLLAAGQAVTIHASVTPPNGFVGRQPINVRAVHGDNAVGGVTLTVVGG
jgi:hypothetical protein